MILDIKKGISVGIVLAFLINSCGLVSLARAGEFYLPAPGLLIRLSPPLNPPILKGLKVHFDNPFRFDFIMDQGQNGPTQGRSLRQEAAKLIKYFLASLTIPEKDLWVNLSPYEKNRIIPLSFGLTEMGRDLLAEDYMLKQITASLIYPEDAIGKKFWKRIYEEAIKRFGTTNISVNTFNKVWILPEKAVVYENAKAGTAYVVEAKLKVMLEEDYFALNKHVSLRAIASVRHEDRGGKADEAIFSLKGTIPPTSFNKGLSPLNALGSQILREIVVPQLSKEVNTGANFATLRQVYNSLILAIWYKKKIKDSIFQQVYSDRNKIGGINVYDPQEKEKIYQQYLQAFKKGVFNYIKDEIDVLNQQSIPRKYFSGGVSVYELEQIETFTSNLASRILANGHAMLVESRFDEAMITDRDISQMLKDENLEQALDARLINYDLAIYDMVKSDQEGSTTVYIGAGADIVHPLLTVNATHNYFVSKIYGINATEMKEFVVYDWDNKDKRGYFWHKKQYGFAHYASLADVYDYYASIILELKALGVNKDAVRVEEISYGGKKYMQLIFNWKHPKAQQEKQYTITFIGDVEIERPDTYPSGSLLDDVLNKGIDYLFTNAGQRIPRHYADFMPRFGRALKNGGFSITNDVDGKEDLYDPTPFLEESGFEFRLQEETSRMKAMADQVLAKMKAKENYGWKKYIRRKGDTAMTAAHVLFYPRTEEEKQALQQLAKRLDKKFWQWNTHKAGLLTTQARNELRFKLMELTHITDPMVESIVELVSHSSINKDVFLEFIRRSPLIKDEMHKLLEEGLDFQRGLELAEGYYRKQVSLSTMELDGLLNLFLGGLGEKEQRTLSFIIIALADKSFEDRLSLIQSIKNLYSYITQVSQWDFVHRFPGAGGLQVVRGSNSINWDAFKIYIPGQHIELDYDTFFSFDPRHATVFAESSEGDGRIVVADIPVASIQHTTWSFFQPAIHIYEDEVRAFGPVTITHVFDFHGLKNFLDWVDFRASYLEQLKTISVIRLQGYDDRREEKGFFTNAAINELKALVGDGGNEFQEAAQKLRMAADRLFIQFPDDYAKIVKRMLAMFKVAKKRKQVARFIDKQFRESPEDTEKKWLDRAMTGDQTKGRVFSEESNTGGIDLNPTHMNLQTQNSGEAIKFHTDLAMLQQLREAPGFVPVIINIQPLTNLKKFLEV